MKKKLLFKNSTQYSKKLYDTFTKFHNEKFSLSYNFVTIFILVLLVYCLIMAITNRILFLSIVFLLALIVFTSYRLFGPMFFYKKQVNKKDITNEQIFKYYFYDKYFKIRDDINFNTIPYYKLYKVFETKNYYYLYYNKHYSFIVNKNGFTQGTQKEFTKFIKSKMWIKYSNCNKTQNSAI